MNAEPTTEQPDKPRARPLAEQIATADKVTADMQLAYDKVVARLQAAHLKLQKARQRRAALEPPRELDASEVESLAAGINGQASADAAPNPFGGQARPAQTTRGGVERCTRLECKTAELAYHTVNDHLNRQHMYYDADLAARLGVLDAEADAVRREPFPGAAAELESEVGNSDAAGTGWPTAHDARVDADTRAYAASLAAASNPPGGGQEEATANLAAEQKARVEQALADARTKQLAASAPAAPASAPVLDPFGLPVTR